MAERRNRISRRTVYNAWVKRGKLLIISKVIFLETQTIIIQSTTGNPSH